MDILEEQGLAVDPDIVMLGFYMNDSRPPWGFPLELGGRGFLRRHSMLARVIHEHLTLREWVREHDFQLVLVAMPVRFQIVASFVEDTPLAAMRGRAAD